METIYLIQAEYHDNFKVIISAYKLKNEADKALKMLQAPYCSAKYSIQPIELK